MLRLTQRRKLNLQAPETTGGHAHVSAASGLVRAGNWLHVVADDSLFLASFPLVGEAPGQFQRLLPGELPLEPKSRKAQKPDMEALCLVQGLASAPHGALLAVPSGSTAVRQKGALVPLAADGSVSGPVREVDFTSLYAQLERELGPLNVEGAAVAGVRMRLLNRGNGDQGKDAVVDLDAGRVLRALEADAPLEPDVVRIVRRWELGRAGTVRLSFTDAAPLPDGRIVFTAAAEDTRDSYADGAVMGSAVGVLAPDGTPMFLDGVDAKVKLEGVDARVEGGRIHLLLVADADDPTQAAPLFETVLEGVPA
ncbi:DUF6929 family protein [Archangium lansingense]|uniref:Uncharacterized protein n=1 Tax=Archangium lansingense TaxID=2995310 RepID=A0ABT3ZVH0_9BACT|nr:hypothetical protein [Archangium lansinium]MCY1073413.1 hypothetical protein [Archangium lansinium]